MKRHVYACVVILIVLLPSFGLCQAPSAGQLAAFDEATLRQVGLNTDAASLLKLLRDFMRNDGDAGQCGALVEQLGREQFEQREAAGRQLIDLAHAALPALRIAHKQHADPEVRQRAGNCILAIDIRLDPNNIMAAVRRLIELRAAGAAECLLQLLPSFDWEIQDEIFHGLPRVALRDGKIDPALITALADKVPMRRAAAALAIAVSGNGEGRDQVRKLLGDDDASVRLRAAQGLLAVHDAASLPVLIALLDEPSVEISWSAEELLHWVAGKSAPEVTVGAASASERKKAVAAWSAWHKSYARKLDWEQLEREPRRPGLYLVCDKEEVWLGGCDGRQRWILDALAHDVTLLPDNRVLLASFKGGAHCCDLDGGHWFPFGPHEVDGYVMCQKLPNGHFLFANSSHAVEVAAAGDEVSTAKFPDDVYVHDAWQPRVGPLICRETALGRDMGQKGFAVLADRQCLIPKLAEHCLALANAQGQLVRNIPLSHPFSVAPLRNGNFLVGTWGNDYLAWGPPSAVVEVDAAGRILWEILAPHPIHRVRSVLERVRIGFDQLRPNACNLDAPSQRARGLRDTDVSVRRRAVHVLLVLQPKDTDTIDALVAALNDADRNVSHTASLALAKIGGPAVPALIEALKTGTKQSRYGAVFTLGCIGPDSKEAVPQLAKLLRDAGQERQFRHKIVEALDCIGGAARAAVPALLEVLQGDDDGLRLQVAGILPNIATHDAALVRALIGALRDPKYPKGQEGAMGALCQLAADTKEALPALLDLLNSPSEPVKLRCCVVYLIAHNESIGEPTVPLLAKLLGDQRQPKELRRELAWCLGCLGPLTAEVLPALEDARKDADEELHLNAREALRIIEQRRQTTPAPVS